MDYRHKRCGFVLIEMMVVMAIISFLLSVALPGYQQYVLQSYRLEATQELQRLANLQQMLFAEQRRYSQDLTEFGFAERSYLMSSGRFRISAEVLAHSYVLKAEAIDAQRLDERCLELSLDQFGTKRSYPSTSCW